jgi:hypothetical protein
MKLEGEGDSDRVSGWNHGRDSDAHEETSNNKKARGVERAGVYFFHG